MTAETAQRPTLLRSLLILGRVSNLPTVWSNCVAGWLMGGAGSVNNLLIVCFGATCLYIAGMYLNDAFDYQFDQQHRPERPIPSGAISLSAVWQWGLGWLGLGLVSVIFLGNSTAIMALLLVASILIYDAVHKMFAISPVIMAACRFFLFLMAASTGYEGITGLSVWSGLVMACYIIGLSFIARKESLPSGIQYWPCIFLVAPLVLAYIVNAGEFQAKALVLAFLLVVWIACCLRFAYWLPQKSIGRCVSGLLAGIVLVDLLAVGGAPLGMGIIFLCLFGLALLFQQYVPAT